MNIPIIVIKHKDYVTYGDQCTMNMAKPQGKFLDLVDVVLSTIWYTFNSQFYQQTDGVTMGGPTSSNTTEIYVQVPGETAISVALHPLKVWKRFVDDVYSILKRTHLEHFFHHINSLHQNIKLTLKEESNGELAFLYTLLRRNNGKSSVLVYRKPMHTDQYLHYSSHYQTNCIITIKGDLIKENTRVKQV